MSWLGFLLRSSGGVRVARQPGIHYARVTESWIKAGGSVGLFKGGK